MKKRKREEGQSTIEFLLSLMFVFGILFFFLKVAINMTNGYFIHYATFMASRAYLVFDNNSNTPETVDGAAGNKAKEVFQRYVPQASSGEVSINFIINLPGTSGILAPYVGIGTQFQQSFSYSNLVGGRDKINFTSESFIGREPSRSDCLKRIYDAIDLAGWGASENLHITYYDNGC